MSLEIASIPLAFAAGALSIMSPCVWPLVPVVMSSAGTAGKRGPIALALGLSLSFAVAGTLLSFVLLNLGLDPVLFRYIAAVMLVIMGVLLVFKPAGEWVSFQLSKLTARFHLPHSGDGADGSAFGQFIIGALLGLVWLPCVGPTLGAAIALASLGENMLMAFIVMLSFGVGTASLLIVAGLLSSAVLNKVRPGVLAKASQGKLFLGVLLLLLGVMVLTGLDKELEMWALQWLPEITFSI